MSYLTALHNLLYLLSEYGAGTHIWLKYSAGPHPLISKFLVRYCLSWSSLGGHYTVGNRREREKRTEKRSCTRTEGCTENEEQRNETRERRTEKRSCLVTAETRPVQLAVI